MISQHTKNTHPVKCASGDVQCIGGYSVHQRDIMSTSGYPDSCGGTSWQKPFIHIVKLQCAEHPQMYSWHPTTWIIISLQWREHPPPPMYSWYCFSGRGQGGTLNDFCPLLKIVIPLNFQKYKRKNDGNNSILFKNNDLLSSALPPHPNPRPRPRPNSFLAEIHDILQMYSWYPSIYWTSPDVLKVQPFS